MPQNQQIQKFPISSHFWVLLSRSLTVITHSQPPNSKHLYQCHFICFSLAFRPDIAHGGCFFSKYQTIATTYRGDQSISYLCDHTAIWAPCVWRCLHFIKCLAVICKFLAFDSFQIQSSIINNIAFCCIPSLTHTSWSFVSRSQQNASYLSSS